MTNELDLNTAQLVDTGPVYYMGPDGLTGRPCRTWAVRHPDGVVGAVSVVTEIGPGKSVTNAAEDVVTGLWKTRGESWAGRLMVVEHYPADTDPERYAVYEHDRGRFTGFRYLPADELHALVPEAELIRTEPAGPVADAAEEFERLRAQYEQR